MKTIAIINIIICNALFFVYASLVSGQQLTESDSNNYYDGYKHIEATGEILSYDFFGNYPEFFLQFFYYIVSFFFDINDIKYFLLLNTFLIITFANIALHQVSISLINKFSIEKKYSYVYTLFLISTLPLGMSHQLVRQYLSFFISLYIFFLLVNRGKGVNFGLFMAALLGLFFHLAALFSSLLIYLTRNNKKNILYAICFFVILIPNFFPISYSSIPVIGSVNIGNNYYYYYNIFTLVFLYYIVKFPEQKKSIFIFIVILIFQINNNFFLFDRLLLGFYHIGFLIMILQAGSMSKNFSNLLFFSIFNLFIKVAYIIYV